MKWHVVFTLTPEFFLQFMVDFPQIRINLTNYE